MSKVEEEEAVDTGDAADSTEMDTGEASVT